MWCAPGRFVTPYGRSSPDCTGPGVLAPLAVGGVNVSPARKALTTHSARSRGHKRYFVCNLLHHNVLRSHHQHQHQVAQAPSWPRRVPRPPAFATRTLPGQTLLAARTVGGENSHPKVQNVRADSSARPAGATELCGRDDQRTGRPRVDDYTIISDPYTRRSHANEHRHRR